MTNALSTKKALSVLASSFLGAVLVLTLSTQASADELGGTAREQARAGKQAYESGDFRRASLTIGSILRNRFKIGNLLPVILVFLSNALRSKSVGPGNLWRC